MKATRRTSFLAGGCFGVFAVWIDSQRIGDLGILLLTAAFFMSLVFFVIGVDDLADFLRRRRATGHPRALTEFIPGWMRMFVWFLGAIISGMIATLCLR